MWICDLGGLKLSKENRKAQRKPSQWHFAHHRSHLDWPRIEPESRSERLAPKLLAPLRTSPVSLASFFRCAVEEHSDSSSYSLAFVVLLVAEGSDILCRLAFLAQMSPWNGWMAVTSLIKWTQHFNRCVIARLKCKEEIFWGSRSGTVLLIKGEGFSIQLWPYFDCIQFSHHSGRYMTQGGYCLLSVGHCDVCSNPFRDLDAYALLVYLCVCVCALLCVGLFSTKPYQTFINWSQT
jgi:hypothetical protein